nr:unnamed protein product [Haemonchus contortus]
MARDVTFHRLENPVLEAEQRTISLATSMATLFVSVVFIFCSAFYAEILKFLIKNRYNRSEALKRERHLYVQMLGLFIGLLLFFIYNIMLFIFSLYSNAHWLSAQFVDPVPANTDKYHLTVDWCGCGAVGTKLSRRGERD